MANNATNKDQFILDYNKQRLSFIDALKRFNTSKGTPFDRVPEVGGQEVDLYHLYQKVTSFGGWQKVNNEQLWEVIVDDFWLPYACTNAAEVLKHIYFRYLNLYEKVNFHGEDVDLRKNDDDEGPTRKKICLPIESIPLSYNYNQHKVTEAQRKQNNLPLDLLKKSPYEKLEMSLQSGLPNEVDHAVNVCILLSTEGRHTLDLNKASHILSLLLAHIGVFEDEDLFLEDMYSSCWTNYSGRDFLRFWYESVKKKDIRSLITYGGHVYSQREMAGEEVLNLGRDIGIGDAEGQRVLQMGIFLRNLSFEECNQNILASNSAVFKFLILCLHNTYGNLRQLALDTLANLAGEILLVSMEDLNTQIMMDFIQESLVSEDRFCLVRGMEVLSKVCIRRVNESVLSSQLSDSVYKRLVDLLTIQDIQIIVHSLEALYKLSKAGKPFTTKIAKVHKAIDTLVSLITIEAQSFGPGSLVGIKVVEYVPPPAVGDKDAVRKPTTVIQPVNPDSVNIYQIPSGLLSHPKDAADAKKGDSPVPKVKKQVTDIHATSTSWLKATYEAKKKSKVNQVELFSEYLQFCRRFGIDNVLSSADFLQLVKKIFDQVEIQSINRKNGDKDVYFEGLFKRTTQLPFAVTTLPVLPGDKAAATATQTNPKTADNAPSGKVSTPQVPVGKKPGRTVIPPLPMAKGKRKPEELVTPLLHQAPLSTPGMSSISFTHTVSTATEAVSSEPACVKNRLAKKICHSQDSSSQETVPSSMSDISSSASSFPHNTVTSQPFSTSHSPDTFVVCPAVTSNSFTPSQRPIYLPGKSTPVTSNSWSAKPAGKLMESQASSAVSQATLTVSSSSLSSCQSNSHATPSPSSLPATQPVMLNNHNTPVSGVPAPSISKQNSQTHYIPNLNAQNNLSTPGVVAQQTGADNSLVSSGSVLSSVSQILAQNSAGLSNSSLSVVQPNVRVVSAPVTPQHQLNAQTIQPSQYVHSASNVVTTSSFPTAGPTALLQQGSSISAIPQQMGLQPSQTGSNLFTISQPAAAIVPQQQSIPQANALGFNQLCPPSTNLPLTIQPSQQQALVTPTIVSMPTVNAAQTILASGHQVQAQGQMIISAPVQQQAVGSLVGPNMVIQNAPGAIVMPSQQVVVQGGVGQSAGTMSFVVPQYAQPSSVIIQQNVLPSLTLQTQQQPIVQTNQVATAALGTRQIIINQNQLPVGMQISSLPGSGGSICLAPQQQQQQIQQSQPPSNFVVQQQQPSGTVINQPSVSAATGLQLNVNGTQVVRTESLAHRSDLVVNVNQNHLALEQPAPTQVLANQPTNSSQLMVHTNQTVQSQQLSVNSVQCNGGSHEVNGVLGSPDSISSDLPPSPQSIGIQSDGMNGQLSDSDSNKSDLAKLVDKSGRPKLNGIIHSFENGCFNNGEQPIKASNPLALGDSPANGVSETGNSQMKVADNNSRALVNKLLANREAVNTPKKIVVNVLQQQSSAQQSGTAATTNGLLPQPNNSHQQTQNAITQSVVVNNNTQQTVQPLKHPQIIKLVPKHLQKQQNQQPQQQQFHQQRQNSAQTGPNNNATAKEVPPRPQQQSHISTLPAQTSAPSPALPRPTMTPATKNNTPSKGTQHGTIIRPGTATKGTTPGPKPGTPQAPKRKAAMMAMVDKTPVRLRKKKGEADGPADSPAQKPVSIFLEYKCEWGNCRRNFASAKHVFLHVFRTHLPKAKESCCQWFTCEKLVRKRWSLVSHIQDYHCTEMAMRAACHRRFTLNQNPSATLPPPPPLPMLYPPDAASQAIRRFAIKPPYPEFTEQREGPVSKHIRLTAALILRNVCHHSAVGRKLISRHESQLIQSCMSSMDSSSALSSCLWDIIHFGDALHSSSSSDQHLA